MPTAKLVSLATALFLPLFAVPAATAPAELGIVTPATDCATLAETDMTAIGGEGSRIDAASETESGGVPVCSVEGTLTPEIRFQVLLPLESWTQRYLQVGCGGLCGRITLTSGASSGCAVLNDGGFVMAATDMGHSGGGGDWGDDPQKRDDFAYRAQHLTAGAARALIRAFYGQDARFSYFNGCSDGGREALMEAMRFPDDFDGIIAGAPAMLFQVQNTIFHAWQAASNHDDDGEIVLTKGRLPILHEAVMTACDGLDGLEDGIIALPAACDFDPGDIVCADGGRRATCLSPAEAEVARKFYEGPKDPETGSYLTAGQPVYGSEYHWNGVYVAESGETELFSERIVDPVLRHLAFNPPPPATHLEEIEFTEATLDALRPRHPLFDATNPDLSAFADAGGKLIMWHGLTDPHIAPANTVALQEAMIREMGVERVRDFERLYLLPGVGHCGGGKGPSNLDLLTAMMNWVKAAPRPMRS